MFLQIRPRSFVSSHRRSLVAILKQGRKGNGDSGHGGLAGGEGGVEEHEGLESYLCEVSVDAGVAGRGPATEAGGRQRR